MMVVKATEKSKVAQTLFEEETAPLLLQKCYCTTEYMSVYAIFKGKTKIDVDMRIMTRIPKQFCEEGPSQPGTLFHFTEHPVNVIF